MSKPLPMRQRLHIASQAQHQSVMMIRNVTEKCADNADHADDAQYSFPSRRGLYSMIDLDKVTSPRYLDDDGVLVQLSM
jgi:hypothetical protein